MRKNMRKTIRKIGILTFAFLFVMGAIPEPISGNEVDFFNNVEELLADEELLVNDVGIDAANLIDVSSEGVSSEEIIETESNAMGAPVTLPYTAEEYVNEAFSYEGMNGYYFGWNVDWCALFVRHIASTLGYSIGNSGYVSDLVIEEADADLGTLYFYEDSSDFDMYGRANCIKIERDSDFRPQPGDQVCFIWGSSTTYDHIAVITDVSGNYISHIDGNSGGTGDPLTNRVVHHVNERRYNSGEVVAYFRPNYAGKTPVGHSPVGFLDGVEGGEGTLRVWGWVYDPDDTSAQLKLDVYVGGNVGSGVKKYQITANKLRENVDAAYHCGKYHGFDETFSVDVRGSQPVYVHAYDVGPLWADNVQLQDCPKIATIKNVPFAIDYGGKYYEVDAGKTKNVTFTFQGDGIAQIVGEQKNDGIVSLVMGKVDWSKRSVPVELQIKGLKGGSTTATFKLLDGSKKVLYQKSVTIYVIQRVSGITLDKKERTMKVGDSKTLHATVLPEDADNKKISWSSSDPSVASVSSSGKVVAKTPGQTTISAKTYDGGFSAECHISVYQPVTSVQLDRQSLKIKEGESSQLQAAILPANATNKKASWTSSDPSVATVDNNGKVKALKAGQTTVTVKTESSGCTANCTVIVIEPEETVVKPISISVSPQNLALVLGENEIGQLMATVSPTNASDKSVTWISSNPAVVTVDSAGKVTAISPGEAEVKAETVDGGLSSFCMVTVGKKPEPENPNPPEDSDDPGQTDIPSQSEDPVSDDTIMVVRQKLDVTGLFPQKYAKYQVTPTANASITSKGILTAKKAGEITVTGLIKNSGKWMKDTDNEILVTAELPQFLEQTKELYYAGATCYALDNLDSSLVPDTWKTSNARVATVDPALGIVTALNTGSARITAVFGEGTSAAKYSFTVKVTIPAISKKKASMLTGTTMRLKLNKARELPMWMSEDDLVAEVDDNGVVTALSAGTTKITAMLDGVEYICDLTVNAPTLSSKKMTLKPGTTRKIMLRNTKLKEVEWSSSDEYVAEVDENGVITAVSPGIAEITTQTGGCRDVCIVTVQ